MQISATFRKRRVIDAFTFGFGTLVALVEKEYLLGGRMRSSLILAAVFCSFYAGISQSAKAVDSLEVNSFVNKNLPPATDNSAPSTGDYKGKDESGQPCTVTIRRYLLPIIVDVSGVDNKGLVSIGEFGIRDSIIQQFETKSDSWRVTVNNGTTEQPAYSSIMVEQNGTQLKISVSKDASLNSALQSCTVSE